MIKKYKSSSRSEIIAFVALLAVLSIALLTEPQSLPAQSDERIAGDSNAVMVHEFRISQDDGQMVINVDGDNHQFRLPLSQLLSEFRISDDGQMVVKGDGENHRVRLPLSQLSGEFRISDDGQMVVNVDGETHQLQLPMSQSDDPNAVSIRELRFSQVGNMSGGPYLLWARPFQPDEQSAGDTNATQVGEFRMVLRPAATGTEGDTQQRELNSNYRTTVAGQVHKPGIYEFKDPSTVLEVLARSGGPLEEADVENIKIVRNMDGKGSIFPFNYRDVIQGNDMHQNILLEHGDIIIVPK